MKARLTGVRVECSGLQIVHERWGQRVGALRAIDLVIEPESWVNVVGPNGAGKTTLLHAIAGRIAPTSGTVLLDGKPPPKPGRSDGLLAVIPQDPRRATVADLTIEQHFVVVRRDLPARAARARAAELMAPYGLAGRLRQEVATLSGGERQLLALLLAAERGARLLLLDEPFAALDAARSPECLALLERMWRDGRTVVLVTHDLDLAARSGDRLVRLEGGTIVADQRHRCAATLAAS